MFLTSIKKITNVYYSIEASLRKLFNGIRKAPTLQKQIEAVRLSYTVGDILQVDVRYCIALAKLVDVEKLRQYTPLVGLGIKLSVVHLTGHGLLLLLNECSRIVRDQALVNEKIQKSRNLPGNLRQVTLDDYLSTDRGHQLEPTEVYNALLLQLGYIQKAMLFESADPKGNIDYYVRQFTHLMGEAEAVILAFLEAQQYAQQGTQSGTKLSNKAV